jgi:hypothetical protein
LQDGAAGLHFEPGDDAQQRGLAAARRTEKAHELALFDGKAHVVKRREVAEPFDDVLDAQGGGGVIGHGGEWRSKKLAPGNGSSATPVN